MNFEDISRLDKPNIDMVVTRALDYVRLTLTYAFVSENGKLEFIGAVEALIESALYYWMLDDSFQARLNSIEEARNNALSHIPFGQDVDPNTGVSRVDIEFRVARSKCRAIMRVITKATKGVSYIDQA